MVENQKSLINWNNKLDIGNCEMTIMSEVIKNEDGKYENVDSLIVSYKMIGNNTFNVFCFNIRDSYLINYWYEGY